MKSVVRDQAGISSPTLTSSKWTLTVIWALLVADRGADAAADELAVLVRPFGLVEGVEHQAEAALALVEVLQARAGGDHVAGAHGRAVGVGLAAVHVGQAHAAGRLGLAHRGDAPHRP